MHGDEIVSAPKDLRQARRRASSEPPHDLMAERDLRAQQDPAAEQDLAERAAGAARAELRGDRGAILGAVGPATPIRSFLRARSVPDRWSFVHVMERHEEGFRILARLPIATRPRGYVNSMPLPVHDRADFHAQLETYELDRLAQLHNRIRIPPTPAEIGRMEEALSWPAAYLAGPEFHHVARAVNLGGLWAAYDADIDERLRRLKITRRAFNARRLQGLRIITRELIRGRVPVR
jgi:hypothetical protein